MTTNLNCYTDGCDEVIELTDEQFSTMGADDVVLCTKCFEELAAKISKFRNEALH